MRGDAPGVKGVDSLNTLVSPHVRGSPPPPLDPVQPSGHSRESGARSCSESARVYSRTAAGEVRQGRRRRGGVPDRPVDGLSRGGRLRTAERRARRGSRSPRGQPWQARGPGLFGGAGRTSPAGVFRSVPGIAAPPRPAPRPRPPVCCCPRPPVHHVPWLAPAVAALLAITCGARSSRARSRSHPARPWTLGRGGSRKLRHRASCAPAGARSSSSNTGSSSMAGASPSNKA